MSHMPTPRRLWNVLMPRPGMPAHMIEPVLPLDSLPSGLDDAPPPRLVRRAIEQALEEGSRRVYEPMQEAAVIETRRRR
jgi:hypothetical protein